VTPQPRPAAAADIEQILRLGEYMYASVGIGVDEDWRESGRLQLRSRLGADLRGWVIDAGPGALGDLGEGTLAACGFVNRTPRLPLPGSRSPLRGYVQWVATDPAAQGKGCGRAIMAAIMGWAVEERIEVLDLHSSPNARSFYLALGFRLSPDVDYPVEVRGVPMQWRVT
jgi:GNAT superfamily N-acetyltransferase